MQQTYDSKKDRQALVVRVVFMAYITTRRNFIRLTALEKLVPNSSFH